MVDRRKRARTEDDTPGPVSTIPTNILETLRNLSSDDQAKLIAGLSEELGVTDRAIKKARHTLPSFSGAKWDTFAGTYGLPQTMPSLKTARFHRHKTPMAYLPPSFHASVFKQAWRAMDVYQDRQDQKREAARVRVLESFMVPLIALFKGRIIDKPESDMPEATVTSGGEVEHEIFAVGDAIFLVVEVKFVFNNEADNLAQLLSELLSSVQANLDKPEINGRRVYGLLTDLEQFAFFSFDPKEQRFSRDEVLVAQGVRQLYLQEMVAVTNKIFSILLTGFISVVQGYRESEETLADTISPDLWDGVLNEAEMARKILLPDSPHIWSTTQELEDITQQGLEHLTNSVMRIPRTGVYLRPYRGAEPRSDRDLEKLAKEAVDDWLTKTDSPISPS